MTKADIGDVQTPDQDTQLEKFRQNARLCIEYVCEAAQRIPKKPVYPNVQPGYLRSLLPSKNCLISV